MGKPIFWTTIYLPLIWVCPETKNAIFQKVKKWLISIEDTTTCGKYWASSSLISNWAQTNVSGVTTRKDLVMSTEKMTNSSKTASNPPINYNTAAHIISKSLPYQKSQKATQKKKGKQNISPSGRHRKAQAWRAWHRSLSCRPAAAAASPRRRSPRRTPSGSCSSQAAWPPRRSPPPRRRGTRGWAPRDCRSPAGRAGAAPGRRRAPAGRPGPQQQAWRQPPPRLRRPSRAGPRPTPPCPRAASSSRNDFFWPGFRRWDPIDGRISKGPVRPRIKKLLRRYLLLAPPRPASPPIPNRGYSGRMELHGINANSPAKSLNVCVCGGRPSARENR